MKEQFDVHALTEGKMTRDEYEMHPIVILARSGAPWSMVMREILDRLPPVARADPFTFHMVFLTFFKVRIKFLNRIGGWNYWDKNGVIDDDEVNGIMEGNVEMRYL